MIGKSNTKPSAQRFISANFISPDASKTIRNAVSVFAHASNCPFESHVNDATGFPSLPWSFEKAELSLHSIGL